MQRQMQMQMQMQRQMQLQMHKPSVYKYRKGVFLCQGICLQAALVAVAINRFRTIFIAHSIFVFIHELTSVFRRRIFVDNGLLGFYEVDSHDTKNEPYYEREEPEMMEHFDTLLLYPAKRICHFPNPNLNNHPICTKRVSFTSRDSMNYITILSNILTRTNRGYARELDEKRMV